MTARATTRLTTTRFICTRGWHFEPAGGCNGAKSPEARPRLDRRGRAAGLVRLRQWRQAGRRSGHGACVLVVSWHGGEKRFPDLPAAGRAAEGLSRRPAQGLPRPLKGGPPRPHLYVGHGRRAQRHDDRRVGDLLLLAD